MELFGAEIIPVLQTVLAVASLLLAGLLVALVTMDRRAAARPAVALESTLARELPPVMAGHPDGCPPAHPRRAPPVYPQRRLFELPDGPSGD